MELIIILFRAHKMCTGACASVCVCENENFWAEHRTRPLLPDPINNHHANLWSSLYFSGLIKCVRAHEQVFVYVKMKFLDGTSDETTLARSPHCGTTNSCTLGKNTSSYIFYSNIFSSFYYQLFLHSAEFHE